MDEVIAHMRERVVFRTRRPSFSGSVRNVTYGMTGGQLAPTSFRSGVLPLLVAQARQRLLVSWSFASSSTRKPRHSNPLRQRVSTIHRTETDGNAAPRQSGLIVKIHQVRKGLRRQKPIISRCLAGVERVRECDSCPRRHMAVAPALQESRSAISGIREGVTRGLGSYECAPADRRG